MNPDQYTLNINAVDADKRKREHVLALLDELSVNRHVPPPVRLQATQLALGVRATYRVGGIEPWIKAQWSRYMVAGSVELVLFALLVTVILTHSWPLLMLPAGLAVSFGVWVGTRSVKRRRVLTSRKLPKV